MDREASTFETIFDLYKYIVITFNEHMCTHKGWRPVYPNNEEWSWVAKTKTMANELRYTLIRYVKYCSVNKTEIEVLSWNKPLNMLEQQNLNIRPVWSDFFYPATLFVVSSAYMYRLTYGIKIFIYFLMKLFLSLKRDDWYIFIFRTILVCLC